jgi:hypothetical protein
MYTIACSSCVATMCNDKMEWQTQVKLADDTNEQAVIGRGSLDMVVQELLAPSLSGRLSDNWTCNSI